MISLLYGFQFKGRTEAYKLCRSYIAFPRFFVMADKRYFLGCCMGKCIGYLFECILFTFRE